MKNKLKIYLTISMVVTIVLFTATMALSFCMAQASTFIYYLVPAIVFIVLFIIAFAVWMKIDFKQQRKRHRQQLEHSEELAASFGKIIESHKEYSRWIDCHLDKAEKVLSRIGNDLKK